MAGPFNGTCPSPGARPLVIDSPEPPLPDHTRRAAFRALVEAKERGLGVRDSRRLVAEWRDLHPSEAARIEDEAQGPPL